MSDTAAPRVLIVEDEFMLLEVMAAELEDAGFAVIPATTAEIALALIAGGTAIDVLFTDIRLPGAMDGWQLAEAVRRLRPGLPIIYATGFTQTPPRMAEGSLFFTKPYRAQTIIDAIHSFGPATA